MRPWHKRLGDLRQLIRQADQNYFDPDLFRLNINNAIQTARTVTFIVQKQKDEVENFDEWYEPHRQAMKADPVMLWLVDARNKIEKQGDLETYSESYAQVIYSYTDQGARIDLKDACLLFCGVKKLVRHVLRDFPTGIAKAASILVERRWVATAFPSMELTDVLEYAYSKLHGLVVALDAHVGDPPQSIPPPRPRPVGSATRRSYIKVSDQKHYFMSTSLYKVPVASVRERYEIGKFRAPFAKDLSLVERAQRFSEVACDLFDRDGYHISLLVYLDAAGNSMRNLQVQFDDRADKLNFWHSLASEAEADPSFCGLLFISEFWNRHLESYPARPISEAPIVGEGLKIIAADHHGDLVVYSFTVESGPHGKKVKRPGIVERSGSENVLVPIQRVWERRRRERAEQSKA